MKLEEVLRPLLAPVEGQFPRPWITDTLDPASARVFTIGRNQRSGFPVDQVRSLDDFMDALFNRGPESCRSMYDRIVGTPSLTRQNTDRLALALARYGVTDVIQTNVVCFSTPMSDDLKHHPAGAARGQEIFHALLRHIRPRVVIAHGSATAKDLRGVFGERLPAPPKAPDTVSRSEINGTELVVIPSLAPPAYNAWSRWSEEHLERVAQHTAEVLKTDGPTETAPGSVP